MRVKHLQYFGFVVLVLGLAGCATSIPKVSYNGPIPTKSAFTNQTVAIHTSVNGDKFRSKGCILELSTTCRNRTLPRKTMISSYNTLLTQGLKNDGAQSDPGLSASYIIYTHLVPSGKHRYLFLKDYDIGRSIANGLPIVALFSSHGGYRYYTVKAHFIDDVHILRHGIIIWHKDIKLLVKTRVYGRQSTFTSGHSGKSKAENVYRTLQSGAIAQILKASEHLEKQGAGSQIIAAGATVPPVS